MASIYEQRAMNSRSGARLGSDWQPRLDLVDSLEQPLAGSLAHGLILQEFGGLSECRAAQERHAENLQVAGLQNVFGVEWNDVHVLQSRKREVLFASAGVILRTTGRSANEGWIARNTRPAVPRPAHAQGGTQPELPLLVGTTPPSGGSTR